MAFSPDGRLLVLAGGESTSFRSRGYLIVWDLREGKILHREDGRQPYRHVSFTSDNKRIVAASHYEVHVYDVQDWKQTVLVHDRHGIHGVALSQDGKMVAVGGQDWRSPVWKMAQAAQWVSILQTLDELRRGKAIVDDPDDSGESLPMPCMISVYDLVSGKSLRTLRGELLDIGTVTFSPDSRILAAASQANITLWNTETWNIEGSLSPPVAARNAACPVIIEQLSLLDNGSLLAVDWHGGVHLWDSGQGKWLSSVRYINAAVSGDGNRLAMVAWNQKTRTRNLVLRDLPAEAPVATLDLGEERYPYDLTLSPDGTLVAWVETEEGYRPRGKVFVYSMKH